MLFFGMGAYFIETGCRKQLISLFIKINNKKKKTENIYNAAHAHFIALSNINHPMNFELFSSYYIQSKKFREIDSPLNLER